MAKTKETIEIEQMLIKLSRHNKQFGCPEVTIGLGGNQRCDFLSYAQNGDWRCYEIKTSIKDFHSKNLNTFVGHFNYYVLTPDVYKIVRSEIPRWIGVYSGEALVRKPLRRALTLRENILFESLLRSVHREACKMWDNENPDVVLQKETEIKRQRAELREKSLREHDLQMNVYTYLKEKGLEQDSQQVLRGGFSQV